MPSIYDLKPRFQALLRPLIASLAARGWTPNRVTLLALALSLVVGGVIQFAPQHRAALLLLPIWLFLRMALNAIDGMMARELNMKTTLGAVLTEFCGVLGQALGAKRHYEGPMGKSDRAFFVGALGLVTPLVPGFFSLWPGLFAAAGALTILTCFKRLSGALSELRQP